MDSFPCAWSVEGASAMARVRSRLHSGAGDPADDAGEVRVAAQAGAQAAVGAPLAAVAGPRRRAGGATVGKGYEPPHPTSVSALSAEVRRAAGVDRGMFAIG